MLPAFYFLMVAFSLVAGVALLAALSLFPPSLPGSVFCWSCISPFFISFYFIFFLLTETRARPSSPLQDLLQTSRYRFMAARVLVIAQLLWVLINPSCSGGLLNSGRKTKKKHGSVLCHPGLLTLQSWR